MISRQSLLGLSIGFALLLNGAFLALAPSLTLYRPGPKPDLPAHLFRVQLRDDTPPEPSPPDPAEAKARSRLTPRPGAIEDLLKEEVNPTPPPELLLTKAVDVPQLTDRLSEETPEREHHLAPDPELESKVDAKIIEISQETARQDIEIARRLVSPSSERLLGGDEFPVLRAKSDTGEDKIQIDLPAPKQSVLNALPAELNDFSSDDSGLLDSLPEPIEKDVMRIARAPILKEMKEERPYQFLDDLVDIHIETYVPPQATQGFFRVSVTPKKGADIETTPKDVTFVIDSSNSISQHKLDESTKAVKAMIAKLRPEDRFNVVVFRDNANFFRPDFVAASDQNKSAGAAYINGIESRGVTDVFEALRPVIQTPPRTGTPGIVYVISDGKPTAGVRDARTIINALAQENTVGNSVFAFSGGSTVNRYLLDLLAYRNKGEARVARSIKDINKDLAELFSTHASPVLVNLDADFGRISEETVFPKKIPDFYLGTGVQIFGQFDPKQDKEFAMRLTGQALDKKKEIIFKADLEKAQRGDERIAQNWAFQRIYYLIGEICRLGEKPELLTELRELSSKYGIITIYNQ